MFRFFAALAISLLGITAQAQVYETVHDGDIYYRTTYVFHVNNDGENDICFFLYYAGGNDSCGYYFLCVDKLGVDRDGLTNISLPYSEFGRRLKIKLGNGEAITLPLCNTPSESIAPYYTFNFDDVSQILDNPPTKIRIETKSGFIDREINPEYFLYGFAGQMNALFEAAKEPDFNSDF